MLDWLRMDIQIHCGVALHNSVAAAEKPLSVPQTLLWTVYSHSKKKIPNVLHTWTSDSFLILIKAGEWECTSPLLAYESYFLTDTDERGLA